MNLEWSPEAIESLRAIAERIEELAGARAAAQFVQRALDLANQVRAFPLLGREVPEFSSESIRERILRPYRLLYRVHEDGVEIIGLIHGATDLSES